MITVSLHLLCTWSLGSSRPFDDACPNAGFTVLVDGQHTHADISKLQSVHGHNSRQAAVQHEVKSDEGFSQDTREIAMAGLVEQDNGSDYDAYDDFEAGFGQQINLAKSAKVLTGKA